VSQEAALEQRSVEINLPCQRDGHPAPITISLVRNPPRPRIWPEIKMTVVVHDHIGGNDTLRLAANTAAEICARCADDLQLLYEKRDVAVSPSLQDDADVGSYIAFRAHDLEAEQISVMGQFYGGNSRALLDVPDEVDDKFEEFKWFRQEREMLGISVWTIAFHGFLIHRSELPAVIAKLREIAG
jgi:hypothetical protein